MPSVARLALVNTGWGFVPSCRRVMGDRGMDEPHGLQGLGFVLVTDLAARSIVLAWMLALFPVGHGLNSSNVSC